MMGLKSQLPQSTSCTADVLRRMLREREGNGSVCQVVNLNLVEFEQTSLHRISNGFHQSYLDAGPTHYIIFVLSLISVAIVHANIAQ
jgi:hypothetical protein